MNPSQPDSHGPVPNPPRRPMRLGEKLMAQGLISAEQLEAALQRQQTTASHLRLGEILVAMKVITPAQATQALAEILDVPFIEANPDMVYAEALSSLPAEFINAHNLLPLSIRDDCLTIAVERFSDICLIDEIRRRSGMTVNVTAAEPENIRQVRTMLLQSRNGGPQPYSGDTTQELDRILDNLHVDELNVVEQRQDDKADLDNVSATDSPIIKLVNCIIQKAAQVGASDIHIEPEDASSFRVRYRIDGDLAETIRPSSRLLPAVVSRIKIMASMDISERRMPQDGSITLTIGNRPIDLRVASMATKYGEKVVMRLVDREAAVRNLDSLGFDAAMLHKFRALIQEANGIVIVTGPTGSGKSTTLYGALAEILSENRNLSTLEDPVERRLPGANQFQVNVSAGLSFAGALRSLLRQDPDVIMVGEIRDPDTARLATEAALTGHLVLTTLHTNDALSSVPRLVNMGVEPYLVAASLRGVLAQRLVRQNCLYCREISPLNAAQREMLAQLCPHGAGVEAQLIGAGCTRCGNTGYAGRIGVFELLILNEEMLSAVARDPSMRTLRKESLARPRRTLIDDGIDKLRCGSIRLDGLLRIVSHIDDLIALPDAPMTPAITTEQAA